MTKTLPAGEYHEGTREHVLFSLYFLLFFGGLGFIEPFISLHFHDIGMSGIQIGTIATISGLLGLLVAPILGRLYDLSQRKRLFFQGAILLSAIFMYLVGWARQYLLVMAVFSLFRLFSASNIPTAENLAFQSANRNGNRKAGFGTMRLWGSLGFAIAALVGGWLIEHYDTRINFTFYLVVNLIAAGLVFVMPGRLFQQGAEKITVPSIPVSRVVGMLLSDKYLWLMAIAMAITNPLGSGIRNFEPIFMKELNISEGMIGVAATLMAVGEVPIMFWADRLIKRLGITWLLLFVFAFDLVRRLIVWFFPLGWLVFILHIAICVSFGLRIVITVSMVNKRVPGQYTTTTLALITMTLFGIASMISNAISGLVYDTLGGRELYLVSAVGCFLALLLASIAGWIEKRSPKIGGLPEDPLPS